MLTAVDKELERIDKAIQEANEGGGGARRGGAGHGGADPSAERRREELAKQREEVVELQDSYRLKYLREYGFRIEDEDIYQRKVRSQGDEGP
jgi:hypothetical protein